MVKKLVKAGQIALLGVLVIQFSGCGTLMYPERRGQRGSRIDVGVAVLDGIGLLFFLIPGIIAYAIDFSNGTIYLPGGSLASSSDIKDLQQVKFDPKNYTNESLQALIKQETGCDVAMNKDSLEMTRLESPEDMEQHFAQALPLMRHDRIALNRN